MDIDPSMLVEELSPGQKQNLQIAKALYQEARILIMDEPTASLGEEETASLMNLVEQLRKRGWASYIFPTIWRKCSAWGMLPMY